MKARKEGWKVFYKLMKRYRREESFLLTIQVGIQTLVNGEFRDQLPEKSEITRREFNFLVDAFEAQSIIGWDQFILGRVPKKWGKIYRVNRK